MVRKKAKPQGTPGLSANMPALVREALTRDGWSVAEVDALLASRAIEDPALRAELDEMLSEAFQGAVAQEMLRPRRHRTEAR